MTPRNQISSPLLNAAIPAPMVHEYISTSDSDVSSDDGDNNSIKIESMNKLSRTSTPESSDGSSFSDEPHGGDSEVFSDHTTTHDDESRQAPIVRKETQLVNCSKMFVVIVVSILAAVVGLSTFFYVRNEEQSSYDASYNNVVNEIITSCKIRTKTVLDNLEGVSVSLTTQANLANMQWPLVVFHDFQVQGMISNQVTGALTLALHPFVAHPNRSEWETFSVDNQDWLDQAHSYDENVNPNLYQGKIPQSQQLQQQNNQQEKEEETLLIVEPTKTLSLTHTEREAWNESGITPNIWIYDEERNRQVDDRHGMYFPKWQQAPAEDYLPTTNLNFAVVDGFADAIRGMIRYDRPVLTASRAGDELTLNYEHGRFDDDDTTPTIMGPEGPPRTYLLHPVYDNLLVDRRMVGFLSAHVQWEYFFTDSLPESEQEGVLVIVKGTCGEMEQYMSYLVSGKGANFLGDSDLHNPIFHRLRRDFVMDDYLAHNDNANSRYQDDANFCRYTASIYPTVDYADQYFTDFPMVYGVLVITCFLITTICFAVYDFMVQRRQRKLLAQATKTNALVSSLFPSNVRDRLLEELSPSPEEGNRSVVKGNNPLNATTHRRRPSSVGNRISMHGSIARLDTTSLGSNEFGVATSEAIFGSKPIADLFPSTTILFADMVGFTAWSSSREPTQVFTLLETVYHSFDAIAKRRRVFKVETVGDCYVAVCGLPIARKDHAVTMARFASDILWRMDELTSQLEKSLGPDTADLCLRVGLHSGQVTAGVLRGEKGRFQLFGDTMNTASRMESTGLPNRIQLSSETADHIVAAGKSKWLVPRHDKIHAKGKGELSTFWLKINATAGGAPTKSLPLTDDDNSDASAYTNESTMRSQTILVGHGPEHNRTQRLVDYNVDILAKLLHQIVVRRTSNPPKMATRARRKTLHAKRGPVLDEVKDILALPQFDASTFKKNVDPDSIMISPRVHQQLARYVAKIAALYRENPFHNFEHASHVTMSVTKLLSRIVNPNEVHNRSGKQHQIAQKFHDHTFGITSDPLTHFACVLSALIHDADHPGVGNNVLVKEEDPMAIKFRNKSVAEQNSVELAWETLMMDDFEDLRACIYCNEDEFARFRQIVVNIVLATDIMDKELGALRKARWEKAFAKDSANGSNSSHEKRGEEDNNKITSINRKATIVLEHLIQASDVAHTMQHWHVYLKWNERLFHEMYKAYLNGRIDTDPAAGWYKGEIGFFDFYIIPLAKKLETCGVFGVSSDEYLNYAKANRNEWESKGEEIVRGYLRMYQNE